MVRKMGVRLTLLVEDEALERLARYVAMLLGYHRSEIHVEPYPVGKGSAKQWIELKYAEQVRRHRARANYQQVSLLVGTDADEQTVQGRCQRLADALQHADLNSRSANERIVLWVPKWNIETWVKHLCGGEVDEDHAYRFQVETADFRPAADEFVRQYRAFDEAASQAPPSLKVGFRETKRMDS